MTCIYIYIYIYTHIYICKFGISSLGTLIEHMTHDYLLNAMRLCLIFIPCLVSLCAPLWMVSIALFLV